MNKIIYAIVFVVVLLNGLSGCWIKDNSKGMIYNPVLPGDYPNPTVIKIKDCYYASATSNEWSPLFPIFKSKDLINWKLISYVFPGGAPDWADKNFWSPELAYDKEQDRVYVYYSARDKKTNRMTIGVASAESPEKPFVDHGPFVSQEMGSIDAFEMRDRDGKIYLIWKEDGSSIGLPTPIYAQEVSNDRSRLLGEKVELIRNDKDWEGGLVEGVCLFAKGDYFYMFYSSGNCCDKECNYKVGVARAKSLLGPWEKFEDNPILRTNVEWKCPGQGAVVPKDDDLFLLYHAYSRQGSVYIGRQGVLEKLFWRKDNWPYFKNAQILNSPKEKLNFEDHFTDALNLIWQWRVTHDLSYATGEDGLMLEASNENLELGSLLVQSVRSTDYQFVATVDLGNTGMNSEGGIALIGAASNEFYAPLAGLGISVDHNLIKAWRTVNHETSILGEVLVSELQDDMVNLKMEVNDGYLINFFVKVEDRWEKVAGNIDASAYVPWGMGFRLGLVAKGKAEEFVNIKSVKLTSLDTKESGLN
ncbi:glycoside hydrolase family 43 protein [Plebeiibacterium marinum]|uniref:Glycoside hydrolase family 43 protein n=1 Tax=Plebeiibacterium marinum TaxID=2992111 RepID=A0AAE3SII7_9BACT|nr:glycoside hydrolase family 43 protein [Plebeiobacterium marinum]MCW3804473.1 glycoside hydrolase family 43 protein [Plebeiobacterium marinum]